MCRPVNMSVLVLYSLMPATIYRLPRDEQSLFAICHYWGNIYSPLAGRGAGVDKGGGRETDGW